MTKYVLSSPLFKAAGVFTVSSVINSAIPFLLIPVFTRCLTPVDYGIVAMFAVITGVINPFVGLNMPGSIGLKYFDRGKIDLPKYIGTCFQTAAVSTIVVFIVLWFSSGAISGLTHIPRNWVMAAIIVAAGQFLIQTNMIMWQVRMQPIPYSIFQNLQTLINVSLSILLVVSLDMNWQGRIIAQLIAILLFAAIGFIILMRSRLINFSFHRPYAVAALKFGVPLIPHDLGSILVTQMDRLLITTMISISDAGIYTVGLQMVSIIELLASSFNKAFSPWLFKQLSSPDGMAKERIVRYTYAYFAFILIFALSLALAMPFILEIFVGKDFRSGIQYTIWLALGFSFSGMYYMVANYIVYSSRTGLLASVTFITGAINILFTYLLIKKNGAVGAAQATALAFFLSFMLTWFLSSRVYKMPWDFRKAFNLLNDKTGMED